MSSNLELSEHGFGYDPTIDEPIEITPPEPTLPLPPSASVDPMYLPPVAKQSTPNCAAWASTYGLATFTAAKAGHYAPNDPSLQASSAYIYIGVMIEDKVAQDMCKGSQLMSYFRILAGGGTPTMEQAQYVGDCTTLWTDYASQNLQPDPVFTIESVRAVSAKNPDDVKRIIVSNRALAYGTSLYTDFGSYRGDPVPYVGNGDVRINPVTGKRVGHCMLIIGYDDTIGGFHIQNSLGTEWGSDGFIWMAYDTFTALAQGKAFHVKD